jgi:2-oxoglutarate ferredoxin oxidoreductase subunit alpha
VTTGDQDADITFVTWGTTRGPVTAASDLLRAKGKKVSMVSFPWVFPFPVAVTIALLAKAKRVIDVEQNATAQLAQLIHSETGIAITERILKYDGRPLLPEEIAEQAVRSI